MINTTSIDASNSTIFKENILVGFPIFTIFAGDLADYFILLDDDNEIEINTENIFVLLLFVKVIGLVLRKLIKIRNNNFEIEKIINKY